MKQSSMRIDKTRMQNENCRLPLAKKVMETGGKKMKKIVVNLIDQNQDQSKQNSGGDRSKVTQFSTAVRDDSQSLTADYIDTNRSKLDLARPPSTADLEPIEVTISMALKQAKHSDIFKKSLETYFGAGGQNGFAVRISFTIIFPHPPKKTNKHNNK